jgi:hypothetical protein
MKRGKRSRLEPYDVAALFREMDKMDHYVPFNQAVHDDVTPTITKFYTTKATLDTVAGLPWYPKRGYRLVSVHVSVTGAPSGAALVWDLKVDGSSAFKNTSSRPSIAAGALEGFRTYPEKLYIPAGAKVQVQGITISSATGPLLMEIELDQAGR